MPFEMDSDLRCPFHERINILRERQEAARQFFSLSRPQTDIQLTGGNRIFGSFQLCVHMSKVLFLQVLIFFLNLRTVWPHN